MLRSGNIFFAGGFRKRRGAADVHLLLIDPFLAPFCVCRAHEPHWGRVFTLLLLRWVLPDESAFEIGVKISIHGDTSP